MHAIDAATRHPPDRLGHETGYMISGDVSRNRPTRITGIVIHGGKDISGKPVERERDTRDIETDRLMHSAIVSHRVFEDAEKGDGTRRNGCIRDSHKIGVVHEV